jgi:hypothetical protein
MRPFIGRQAPVKRCLARCQFASQRNGASLHPTFCCYSISFDELTLKVFARKFRSLSVRKQQLHVQPIGWADQRELFQLAHAAGLFRAQQMPLPRMHAKNFARGCDLETLLGATVRLQLHLGLGTIPWHF